MCHRVRTFVPSSPSTSTSAPAEVTYADKQRWEEIQLSLKEKLITFDDFKWKVASTGGNGGKQEETLLKYVGGVDVSYSKEDPFVACGTIVVLDVETLNVVYQDHSFVTTQVPYVAGFLAFREVPVLKDLLDKMKRERSPFFPQAMRPTKRPQRPLFISIGHRVSLETAIQVVKMTCKYCEPEPIRQADLILREYIQKHDSMLRCSASFSGSYKGQHGGDATLRGELNQLVDRMGRINVNNETHRRFHYSSSSYGKEQSHWGIQSGWNGSVQSGGGSFSRPPHREIGACFECGQKGHIKRYCPELQR